MPLGYAAKYTYLDRGNQLVLAQYHRPVNHIRQLSDVTWPSVIQKSLFSIGSKTCDRFVVAGSKMLQVVSSHFQRCRPVDHAAAVQQLKRH